MLVWIRNSCVKLIRMKRMNENETDVLAKNLMKRTHKGEKSEINKYINLYTIKTNPQKYMGIIKKT